MAVNIGQRHLTSFTFITHVSRICPAGAGNALGDHARWSVSVDDDITPAFRFELNINDRVFYMNILTGVANTSVIH